MLAKRLLYARYVDAIFTDDAQELNEIGYLGAIHVPELLTEGSGCSWYKDYQPGVYRVRPLDVLVATNRLWHVFNVLFEKAEPSSVKTNVKEGLLYWLCLNNNKAYKNEIIRMLLIDGSYRRLEHGITVFHLLAALGELPKGDIGSPDINGLYPYHYAIVANQENFIAWLPDRTAMLTPISDGYYKGADLAWWVSFHFASYFWRFLEEANSKLLPLSTDDIDFNACLKSSEHPVCGLTVLWNIAYNEHSGKTIDFLKDRPSISSRVDYNATSQYCESTLANYLCVDSFETEGSMQAYCEGMSRVVTTCKSYIDILGIAEGKSFYERSLYVKLADRNHYDTIEQLLKHPAYPSENLCALLELMRSEKLAAKGQDGVDYNKIINSIHKAIAMCFERNVATLPPNIELLCSGTLNDELKEWLRSIFTAAKVIPPSFQSFASIQTIMGKLLLKFSVNSEISKWLLDEFFRDEQFKPSPLYPLTLQAQFKFVMILVLTKSDKEGNELLRSLLSESLAAETTLKVNKRGQPEEEKEQQACQANGGDAGFWGDNNRKKSKGLEKTGDLPSEQKYN